MFPPQHPQLVVDYQAERLAAAEAHRTLRPLREAATRRRAERRTAFAEAVGVRLVKVGLRVVASARRRRERAPSSHPVGPSL